MEQRTEPEVSPYRTFTRAEWAAMREDTPMTLTPSEVSVLRSMHDRLDMEEVEEIYLPLSRLLSLYVTATQRLFHAQQDFLRTEIGPVALATHRAIKRALDPAGLFNPGSMFSPAD